MRVILSWFLLSFLAVLFALPAGTLTAKRVGRRRYSIRRQRRYTLYHRRYRYRKGGYYYRGRRYYYHRGRYYPDHRVIRSGRYYHQGRYYSLRRGRYYRRGHYYYYSNGRYYRDRRRFRLVDGRYHFYYRGGWYVYIGGRYYYNGRYYYYYRGRYYLDDSIPYNYAEIFEDRDIDSGELWLWRKNPAFPGRIHYVNRKWDPEYEDWRYYRSAYRPGRYKVSGPHTLKVARRRVRQLNRAALDRDDR